jgi:hypothetical protein
LRKLKDEECGRPVRARPELISRIEDACSGMKQNGKNCELLPPY